MSSALRSLSDQDVLSRIHILTTRERKLTLSVLLHLNEIERRKLFLKQGHGSMFDYCTSGLGYSASAAKRRICTARCIARVPAVLGLLEANDVNLSTVTQVSRILNPENASVLLERIRGRSQREVEAVVAEYEPLAAMPRDRVRTVVVRVPAPSVGTGGERVARVETVKMPEAAPEETSSDDRSANQVRNGPDLAAASPTRVQFERRAVVQFATSEAAMAKLERVRELASHRLPPNAPLDQVIEYLADYFIQREDPAVRQERREERKERRSTTPVTRSTNRRQVPARVRDAVFVRDRQRCAFVGPGGNRCDATRVLQIDHIQPVARGGASTIDNLRVLCAYHNRLESERLMGPRGPRAGPGR